MSAPTLDFDLYRGDSALLRITIKDKAGVAVALGGVQSVRWRVSKLNDDGTFSSTPGISKALAAGISITDSVNGKVEIAVDPADTAGLKAPQAYRHELEVVDSGGRVQTVLEGTITLLKDLIV